jgi:hypothetical protein
MGRLRASVAAWVGACVVFAAPLARAADKACFDHADLAQKLRSAGKLIEARRELAACSRDECAAVVRADCSRWSIEVNQELPSVVIRARDASGNDVSDVKVTMDGAVITTQLDGRLIEVNPGRHEVHYERAGSTPVDTTVVILTGEKGRVLSVELAPVAPPPPPPKTPPPVEAVPASRAPAETPPDRPVPAGFWILGGVGVVAAASFAYWGIRGQSDYSHLESTCSPRCDPTSVTSAKREVAAGDISLAVAVVALGAAGVVYLTRPTRSGASASLRVTPTPSGAYGSLDWSF